MACALPLAAQPALSLASDTWRPGYAVPLNLSLTTAEDTRLAAFQWVFTYPADEVTGFSVAPGPALVSGEKQIICAATPGEYRCLAVGMNADAIPGGVAAVVWVTPAQGFTGTIEIDVKGARGVSLTGDEIPLSATGATLQLKPPAIPRGGTTRRR